MQEFITKIITTEDGLEKEIKIYPLQFMDFFDVIFMNEEFGNVFYKQTKSGKIEIIDLIDLTNQENLSEENFKIVFKALKDYLTLYVKENNFKFIVNENYIVFIDNNFLENIETLNGNIISTTQDTIVDYQNIPFDTSTFIDYISDYLINKEINKKFQLESFKSKEGILLKKDIENLNSEKEKEKLFYQNKILEIEKGYFKELKDFQETAILDYVDQINNLNIKLNQHSTAIENFVDTVQILKKEKISLINDKDILLQSISKLSSKILMSNILTFVLTFIIMSGSMLYILNLANINLEQLVNKEFSKTEVVNIVNNSEQITDTNNSIPIDINSSN